jgi:hypothetical protein
MSDIIKSNSNEKYFNFIGGANSYLMNGKQARSISESRIVSVEYDKDTNEFLLGEECDKCFSATLSVSDFDEWIEELKSFRDKIKEL